jgi:two-component system cell cycle sensor histidine kinase/response regulator CckA
VNEAGKIDSLGPRLREIAGGLLDSVCLFDLDALDSPVAVRDFGGLRKIDGEVQVVTFSMLKGLRLRGEFAYDAKSGVMRFLGHPWITSLDQLSLHGLTLRDYPPNAGLGDLLILLQTSNNSTNELKRLAGQLQETTAALRERNVSLEAELSKRERLEAQLQQAQKMEAVGRLAGGIAHNFNNVLMAISGHAELGTMAGDIDDVTYNLEQIISATERGAEITEQLLGFARRQPIMITDVLLSDSLQQAVSMLSPLLSERHELRVQIDADAGAVRCDPAALQQAIVNLVMNARDAILGEGTIFLHARCESSNAPEAMHGMERPPGEWGVIEVRDSGQGMDAPTLERIFEPFFTTKDRTEGTGLGLATVWWIIEQAKGTIRVSSELGEGTRFELHLPRAQQEVPAPSSEPEASSGKGQRVLLVEDDHSARAALVELLRSSGWEVTSAASAEHALELVDRADEPFHVLISDLVLPGRSGRELAAQLHQQQPLLKIVLISGYDADREGAASPDGEVLVRKPFSLSELTRAISSLDSTSPTAGELDLE